MSLYPDHQSYLKLTNQTTPSIDHPKTQTKAEPATVVATPAPAAAKSLTGAVRAAPMSAQ